MLDLAAFRLEYPEFQSAEDAFVSAYLARAARRIDPRIWGELAAEGHGLLAAHLVATSPYGQMARMVSADGDSTYGKAFRTLVAQVTCGLRVV